MKNYIKQYDSKIEQEYIECLINNEYEINRSELVNEINACTSQFIAVIGGRELASQ